LPYRATLLDIAFDVAQRIPLVTKFPGIYEVLSYDAELELRDTNGRTAIYRKRQHVRFVQDNIIAYQDTAWGDGEIFAEYHCSPGVEVDRYREGHRYHILISLRETKNQNDQAVLNVEWLIRGGFTKSVEEFQVDIDHRTRHLNFTVVFPAERVVKQVSLIEHNANRTTKLAADHREQLPDGRYRYVWVSKRPRLYETYIMRWEWSTAIEEQEAESFVALIQQRLMKLNRLRELYGEGTSIPALKPYAHGFDFTR